MARKIIVNKGDIYWQFEIVDEIQPLKTPSWENKRQFIVKCLNCWNNNYRILLNHLRQRNILYCEQCSWKHSKEFLNKDN